MRINGQFCLLIVKASCPMVIILHHAAYRDIQMHLIKHLQRHINLPFAAIQRYNRFRLVRLLRRMEAKTQVRS